MKSGPFIIAFICPAIIYSVAGSSMAAARVSSSKSRANVAIAADKTAARKKLAVVPFSVTASTIGEDGHYGSDEDLGRKFAQAMVMEFTQGRRFVVVDREYVDDYLREKGWFFKRNLINNDFLNVIAGVGADIVMVGTVSEFTVVKNTQQQTLTGEVNQRYHASATIDYRLIDISSRQILWSDSPSIKIDTVSGRLGMNGPDLDAVIRDIVHKAARKVVRGAMESAYPIRIAALNGNGEVVLNQGGATLDQGEIFEVYLLGKKIKENYSGEYLGQVENWVATIKVTRVTPKSSYATVEKGDYSLISNGSVCRRPVGDEEQSSSPDNGRPTNVKISESGSVLLPFDK